MCSSDLLRRCLQRALVTALAEVVLKRRAGAARAGEFGHHVGALLRVADYTAKWMFLKLPVSYPSTSRPHPRCGASGIMPAIPASNLDFLLGE